MHGVDGNGRWTLKGQNGLQSRSVHVREMRFREMGWHQYALLSMKQVREPRKTLGGMFPRHFVIIIFPSANYMFRHSVNPVTLMAQNVPPCFKDKFSFFKKSISWNSKKNFPKKDLWERAFAFVDIFQPFVLYILLKNYLLLLQLTTFVHEESSSVNKNQWGFSCASCSPHETYERGLIHKFPFKKLHFKPVMYTVSLPKIEMRKQTPFTPENKEHFSTMTWPSL